MGVGPLGAAAHDRIRLKRQRTGNSPGRRIEGSQCGRVIGRRLGGLRRHERARGLTGTQRPRAKRQGERTVPGSRRNPGSGLAASLELADPVEQLAYEHGAGVVEPEVAA